MLKASCCEYKCSWLHPAQDKPCQGHFPIEQCWQEVPHTMCWGALLYITWSLGKSITTIRWQNTGDLVKQPKLVSKGNQDSCFPVSAVVRKLFFLNLMNSLIVEETSHFHQLFSLASSKQLICSNVSLVLPVTVQLAKNTPASPEAHSLIQLSHHIQAKEQIPASNPRPTATEVSQRYSANTGTSFPQHLQHGSSGDTAIAASAFVLKVFKSEVLDLPGCKWLSLNGFWF